jgi:hypothetical protein
MEREQHADGTLLVGAVLWSVLLGGAWVLGHPPDLVRAMLALAVVVVLPGAVPLHPALPRGAARWALGLGAPLALALLLPKGPMAATLAVPWVLGSATATAIAVRMAVATGIAVRVAVATRQGTRGRAGGWVELLVWPAACGYLFVGALWGLADRAGLEPGGFGPPLVALTAVHFHYAGCASAVLAGCALRRSPGRLVRGATAAIISGPPLVALGFVALGPLQVVGAVLLAGGLLVLSWVVLRHIAPIIGGAGRVLLTVSALAVVVPMLLAVQWALGSVVGTPALAIPAMARWHGAVNAIGFALTGVLGWRLERSARSARSERSERPDRPERFAGAGARRRGGHRSGAVALLLARLQLRRGRPSWGARLRGARTAVIAVAALLALGVVGGAAWAVGAGGGSHGVVTSLRDGLGLAVLILIVAAVIIMTFGLLASALIDLALGGRPRAAVAAHALAGAAGAMIAADLLFPFLPALAFGAVGALSGGAGAIAARSGAGRGVEVHDARGWEDCDAAPHRRGRGEAPGARALGAGSTEDDGWHRASDASGGATGGSGS